MKELKNEIENIFYTLDEQFDGLKIQVFQGQETILEFDKYIYFSPTEKSKIAYGYTHVNYGSSMRDLLSNKAVLYFDPDGNGYGDPRVEMLNLDRECSLQAGKKTKNDYILVFIAGDYDHMFNNILEVQELVSKKVQFCIDFLDISIHNNKLSKYSYGNGIHNGLDTIELDWIKNPQVTLQKKFSWDTINLTIYFKC
jgi:hypothetical protein